MNDNGHGKNDNTEELRRERKSLLGKIHRRKGTIAFAQRDLRAFSNRLFIIEEWLRERAKK